MLYSISFLYLSMPLRIAPEDDVNLETELAALPQTLLDAEQDRQEETNEDPVQKYRDEITAFYQSLPVMDELVQAPEGSEEQELQELEKRYGLGAEDTELEEAAA